MGISEGKVAVPFEKSSGLSQVWIDQIGLFLPILLKKRRHWQPLVVVEWVRCQFSRHLTNVFVRGVGSHRRFWHRHPGDREVVFLVVTITNLAGVEVVVITVGQPPVSAFRTEVLDIAVGNRLCVGFTIGTLSTRLLL